MKATERATMLLVGPQEQGFRTGQRLGAGEGRSRDKAGDEGVHCAGNGSMELGKFVQIFAEIAAFQAKNNIVYEKDSLLLGLMCSKNTFHSTFSLVFSTTAV